MRDGGRGRPDIVDEIVGYIRPLSQSEKAVCDGVANDLDQLLDVVAKSRKNVGSWEESKKAARGLAPALTRLINVVDGIPADNLLFDIPGFSSRSEFLRHLQLLREMCARSEQFKSKVDPTKRFCAFFACGMISRFSKKRPTATVEGPLRTVASLLHKTVTGNTRRADLKRACDLTLKVFKHSKALN
jgi:hypothetical protein